jgi:hypothetical protein
MSTVAKHLTHAVIFLRDTFTALGLTTAAAKKGVKNTLLTPIGLNTVLPNQGYLEHNAEVLGVLFALFATLLFLLSCIKKR